MLSWTQLQDAVRAGVEIGSHAVSHRSLDALPETDLRDEVTRSKAILEDRLGVAVDSFAYPYGHHSGLVRRAVANAGYASACAVGYRMCCGGEEWLALSRHIALPGTDGTQLTRLAKGAWTPMSIRRDRLASRVRACLRGQTGRQVGA